MNSFIKKAFSILLIGCLLVLGLGVVKVNAADPETIDFSAQNYSNGQEITSISGTDFTITFNKGTNSNAPKYYTSGTAIRAYGGNTFTVSSEKTITKIVITFGSSDGSNEITTDSETYSGGTWTGAANSVIFTIGGTSGNRRIHSIAVTTDDAIIIPQLSTPTNVSVDQNSVITFDTVENATSYTATVKDGENEILEQTVVSGDLLKVNKEGSYTVTLAASGSGYLSSESESFNWYLAATWYDDTKTIVEINAADVSDYYYYEVSGNISACASLATANFYLSDETGTIYVYHMFDTNGVYTPLEDLGIDVGDNIIIRSTLSTYSNKKQLGNGNLVSFTPNYKVRFESLNPQTKLMFDYTISSSVSNDNFELFSGDLIEGDYIIYYEGKAMNSTVESDRLQYEEITPINNVITTTDESIIWHIAPSGDYWTIYNAESDKYAASTGAKNKAAMIANGTDDKALWTVNGNETYEFVNKKNSDNNVNAILRNNGTYGFACYGTSTGKALSLYKRTSKAVNSYELDKDDNEDYKLNLMFGQMIKKNLYDSLINLDANAEFGMFYITSTNASGSSISEILELVDENTTIEDVIEAYSLRKVVAGPVRVTDDGSSVDENGNYYQFGVSISSKRFGNKIDEAVQAVGYVLVNGEYYLSGERTESVKSVATLYLSGDTSSYSQHLGILQTLSNYK